MGRSITSFLLFLGVVTFLVGMGSQESVQGKDKKYWTEGPAEIKNVPGLDPLKLNQLFTNLAETMSPTVVSIFSTSRAQAPRRSFRSSPHGRGGRPGPGQEMDPEDLFKFFFGNPFDGRNFMEEPRESQALGSGFVINEEGYIVTNSHVVRPVGRNADEVRVKFIGKEKSEGIEAEIIGVDSATDVALLKLKTKVPNLKVASLGNSDELKVGNWVIAIGNPYGHAHTVTQGIVSALGRNIPDIRAEFIQTSASINPGNSGGPLINLQGEVIGINTAIDPRAQGIGFAIPVNGAKSIIKQLIENGEVTRGWIGVGIADISPQMAKELDLKEPGGVLVQNVEDGQPADRAGIKPYDVIKQVDKKKMDSAQELVIYLGGLPIGHKAQVQLIRNGHPKSLTVKIGKRPSENVIAKNESKGNDKDKKSIDLSKAGLVLQELTPDIRRKYDINKNVKGVFVNHVLPYSPAAQANLEPGDVISEVNRKVVSSVKAAEAEISRSLKNDKRLLLLVNKRFGTRIVLLDLAE